MYEGTADSKESETLAGSRQLAAGKRLNNSITQQTQWTHKISRQLAAGSWQPGKDSQLNRLKRLKRLKGLT